MLTAHLFQKANKRKMVLVTEKDSPSLQKIIDTFYRKYLPFTTTVILYKGTLDEVEYFSGYDKFTEEVAAYICEDFQCREPIFNLKEIIEQINHMK